MISRLGRLSVALVLAVAAQQVLACRCLEPASTADAYGRAHLVVRATVLAVDGVGDSPGGARAKLRVAEAWKTDVPSEVVVSTSTTCAFDFHAGSEYLLYLYPGSEPDQWSTRICVGNCLASTAEASLSWLHTHGKAARVVPAP